MLTRRGWALVSGSFILAAAGRTIGVLELFVLAAGAMGLVAVALVSVLARGRVRLEGTRRAIPSRVHAGSDSRVELELLNEGDRATPVVALRDTVVAASGAAAGPGTGPRVARFHVAPLAPGESNRAAYRLGAERRGLFRIGPLEVVVGDPFGLVARTSEAAPATELTVYPRVDVVTPPPFTSGHDPRSGGSHATFLGHGEEFYGLRGYEVGDDLRQVHWPSTARQDELMIRQQELPWQGRATVVLDVRNGAHNEETLEVAVSAAASVLTASWQHDRHVRLVTTDGLDSGFGTGAAHLSAAMEHLAVVEPGSDRLDALLSVLRRRATGALVVITTTAPGGHGLERLLASSAGFGWLAVVMIARTRGDAAAVPAAALVVRVEAGERFADAWNRTVVGVPARATGARR